MRLVFLAAVAAAPALAAPAASAFLPTPHHRPVSGGRARAFARSDRLALSSMAAAAVDSDSESSSGGSSGVSLPPSASAEAKSRLLTLARRLSPRDGGDSETGVFVVDPDQRSELRRAAAELEAICGPMTGERERQLMAGEWTLLCTTNVANRRPGGLSTVDDDEEGGTKKKRKMGLPFKLPEDPVRERIRDKVRRSFEVTQRIRTSEDDNDSAKISRVDNVVEFVPPFDTLSDILSENSPLGVFKGLKLNPLEVKKTRVTLIHDAEVESTSPVLRTKLSLKSVVLTVAGTSQFLEPDGADVLGLNVPLGEFLQSGYFDTTYVDENLRVSRGSQGPALDVLRVFVRRGMYVEPLEGAEAGIVDADERPAPERTELETRAESLRDAVGGAVRDAVETLEEDAGRVREKVEGVRDAVLDVAGNPLNVTREDLDKVRESVEAVGKAVEDTAEDLAVSVSDSAVEVQKAAEGMRDATRDEAEETAEEVRENVESAVKGLEDQAEEAVAAAVGKEDAGRMREAVDEAVEDVVDSVKNVTEALRDAVGDVAAAVEDGADKIQEAAGNATSAMSKDVDKVVKAAEDIVEDVAEAVRVEEEEGGSETEEEEKKDDQEKK